MKKFLILLSLSLLLGAFDRLGMIRPVRGEIEKILIPIEQKLYSLRVKKESGSGISCGKTADLEAQILSLRKESSDMRRLLGVSLPEDWRFLPAKIMAEEEGVFLIDKGRKDGVTEGQVAVFENFFLGKVISVSERISRLETLKSPKIKIRAVVKNSQGEVKASGLVLDARGRLVIDLMLKEEKIEEGDLVFTFFPKNLLIGKIAKVSPLLPSEIFQKAEIEPLLDPLTLENIFLVVLK